MKKMNILLIKKVKKRIDISNDSRNRKNYM